MKNNQELKSLCFFDMETGEYVKLTGKIKSEEEFADFTRKVYGSIGRLDTVAATNKVYKEKNTTGDFMEVCRNEKNSPVIILDDFAKLYKSDEEMKKKAASRPIKGFLNSMEFVEEQRSTLDEYNAMIRATEIHSPFHALEGNSRIREELNSALRNTIIMQLIKFKPVVVEQEEKGKEFTR